MNESGPTWWDALRWWMIIPIIICAIGGTIVVRYLRKNRKDKDTGEGDSGSSGGSGSAGAGSAGSGGSDGSGGSGGSPGSLGLPGSSGSSGPSGSGVSGEEYAGSGSAAQNTETPMTSIKSDNSAVKKASETIGTTSEATGETGNPEIKRLFASSAAPLAATDTKSPRLSRVERAKKLRDSKNPSRARPLSPSYGADQNPQRPEQHTPSHRKEKILTK